MPHEPKSACCTPRRPLAAAAVAAVACATLTACDPGPAEEDTVAVTYPETRRSDQVDDYFGTQVADPYRWFEDLDSPETAAWVKAQNDISFPYLEAIPQRAVLIERLTALWDHERYGQPFKEGDKYFYSRNDGLQNQDVLYVADSLDQPARVLLDPNGFSEDGTVSLATYSISPDAKWIAYAKSDGGSDWDTWHVRDIATGEDLPEVLHHTKFTQASWAHDGSGFYYSRYPEGADGKGDDQQAVKVYFHRLRTDQSADELVYEIPGTPRQNPYAFVTDDGRFLVVSVNKEGVRENAVHYRRLDRPGSPITPLLAEFDAQWGFLGNDGDTFYFQTDLEAPKGRVVAIALGQPARQRTVLPETEDAMQSASLVGGHLVAEYLHDAQSLVRVHRLDGTPVRDVELPGIGSVFGFGGKLDDTETFYTFTSFTVPSSVYRYDVATGESSLWKQAQVPIELADYTTEQVFYESKDGTRVPMFLTYRQGLERNGEQPTLLYGYGGFNISQTPAFSVTRAVWLEMGGVFALANLRGGGEYGEDWHLAGTKSKKQNVFDDFIAAAEWLIANQWTKPERLAIQGGSNGGLLVGAAITQRPELFGAALPAVGVLDMLRYHTASANARNWSIDYGLSEIEEDFRAQLAYSPLHNVEEGTCYPPTLVTTADHDDRVVPWHSFKFGAELQRAQGCANPILVRVETRAGHGAGKPTWMRIEEVADQWAFLAKHLGVKVPEMPG
jgi:prolyl oligopeptidase